MSTDDTVIEQKESQDDTNEQKESQDKTNKDNGKMITNEQKKLPDNAVIYCVNYRLDHLLCRTKGIPYNY